MAIAIAIVEQLVEFKKTEFSKSKFSKAGQGKGGGERRRLVLPRRPYLNY